jgi:hypothetical protein
MQLRGGARAISVALLLEFLSLATALAHDGHNSMGEEAGNVGPSPVAGLGPSISLVSSSAQTSLPSYFGYSAGSGFLYAHVFFMVLGWMFLLPVGA